ncbi:HAD family hydrolase [Sporolactobacillus shoreae]|uniref:HAD family hydrolase n=1 Tax=Sporolactobacillus shoreae TaxID=1465501 RepID=A0A4Z0GKR0_9BACL|nr:HAD family hydrolase [Sporolactobacillus shoreae]TGA96298.1 HAD family hydrolase [Sporolactobacillus shoreae]
MKAIGFDLGSTLIKYEDVPQSWKSLYKEALKDVLISCDRIPNSNMIGTGEEILSKYNTRMNYREVEVSSNQIFSEMLEAWDLNKDKYLNKIKKAFYSYFQRTSHLYDDTIITLETLKKQGVRIGILTDVPYGMDKDYVLTDIEAFKGYIDVLLTSVDVGFRKPNKQGYSDLLNNLDVTADETVFVGDEQKDILGANSIGIYSVLINRQSTIKEYGQRKMINSLMELMAI